ncbi:MAG: hypothetical protein CVU06_06775 [Bacteroidetes bacterium HGW-Bacteroidetes-22]|nr:MAG: hypothetical protein CVU06_06775 [Bacteroidetes bacterium HGW-Bacteroidetes-22]
MDSGYNAKHNVQKMRFIRTVSTILAIFILTWLHLSARGQYTIQIKTPTVEEESEYIWHNICMIGFFDQHAYKVAWPNHPIIAELLDDARNQRLNDSSYNTLINVMRQSVYRKEDYAKGYGKVSAILSFLDSALDVMHRLSSKWDYNPRPGYTILLTLYGPGGSYNDETGQITLFTTVYGTFKGYNNPENTLIHELFHIMTEQPVVQKYNLTHQQKERLVDLFVKTWFATRLPDYRIQGFGDSRMDEWFNTREKFTDLPASMHGFLKTISAEKQ